MDDQRFPFFFRGLDSLLLVTFLAQQLLLSWPGSSGTTAAFGGVLASLTYYVSLWLQGWSWMKEESGARSEERRTCVLGDVLKEWFMAEVMAAVC